MEKSKPERVLAIDAFRGITILVMIFVNTLSGVGGMPLWMAHVGADVDGMTFPDVVFPAFLFIVGMSIPFAMAQRRAAGDSGWRLWRHVLSRAAGLLVLGVFMVNAEAGYNEAAMGVSIHAWSLMFYVSAILVWAVYRFESATLTVMLRALGGVGLIALALVYRGGEDGTQTLTPQWWGILGLIGWAYLYATVIWRLTAAGSGALVLAVLTCVAFYCATNAPAAQNSEVWRALGAQAGNAVHTAIVLCGVLTSAIFFGDDRATRSLRFRRAAMLAIALAVLAYVLRPWYTISKIAATPSWALYSAAICVALFSFLYWLVDLGQKRGWTAFFRPAAANPLLTYIIPFIVSALMGVLGLSFPALFSSGVPGLLWAVAYAIGVMAIVAGLNRLHIKLQL